PPLFSPPFRLSLHDALPISLVVHPLVSGGARAGAVPASALIDESREVYVASKRSKVFHKADCAAAQHIKKDNLVHFTTREAAAKDRKSTRLTSSHVKNSYAV